VCDNFKKNKKGEILTKNIKKKDNNNNYIKIKRENNDTVSDRESLSQPAYPREWKKCKEENG
jgi:hypothetical protein